MNRTIIGNAMFMRSVLPRWTSRGYASRTPLRAK